LFSGIRVATVAEFDQGFQTLLGRHRRIAARIGFAGVLEAGNDPDRFLHIHIIAAGLCSCRWKCRTATPP
jgi:hypothetical protein